MQRFRTTITPSASRGDLLRAHFDGLRRLVADEPELFAVMGELALRSARDPAIAEMFEKTVEIWHRTILGLSVSAGKTVHCPPHQILMRWRPLWSLRLWGQQ